MINFFKNLFRKPDKQIAMDVELDGMHPSRIIQLSYLIIEGKRVRGKNFYFAAKAINRYARQVHGLSVYQLRKLSGGKGFIDYADEIYRDFADCKLIIGHDVAGDIRYVEDGAEKRLPIREGFVEPSVAGAVAFDTFQFLRNGYFCVDCKDSTPEKLVFNRVCSMKSSYKPA